MLGAPQILILWINNQVKSVKDRMETSWCECDLSWTHLGTVSGLNRNCIHKVPADLMIIHALISKNNQADTLTALVSNCIHCKLSSWQLNFCFLINYLPKSQTITQGYIISPSYILQVKYIQKPVALTVAVWAELSSEPGISFWVMLTRGGAKSGSFHRSANKEAPKVNPPHKCLPSVRHQMSLRAVDGSELLTMSVTVGKVEADGSKILEMNIHEKGCS